MSGAVDVYLGLGSNQGNRRENIDSALSMLDSNEKIHVDKVSDIIETEPWGFAAEQNFLNCVARVQVEKTLTPEELLDVCKGIANRRGDVSVWLGATASAAGLREFVAAARKAGHDCRSLTETG